MRAVRRIVAGLAGLALAATGVAGCQWPDGTRYVDEVFDQVDVTRDITFATVTDSTGQRITLELDVYTPRGDTVRNRPALIWGFGGAWVGGDKNQLSAYATDAAERGYVGIAIEYRTRPGGGPVLDMAGDAYDDTLAAVAWLKANASRYAVNPNAIVVGGYSAGGINAANTAFWPGERGPATSPVAGAVAIAGFTFGQPGPGDPPVLMFHGDADPIVPYGTGRATCDNTKAAGNHCTFFTYAGADHFIAFSQIQSIQERTADWVFETVLYPQGYRP